MTTCAFLQAPRADARTRLFCFAHAGASAAAYRHWTRAFPSELEVCPVELPGRGIRHREASPATFRALVEDLATALLPHLDRRFAFFGYSFGALLAFELTRQLRKRSSPGPAHLFVAARSAPSSPPIPSGPRHDMPVPVLLESLRTHYGRGLHPTLQQDPEMLAFLVRAIRADLRVLETYLYLPGPPLACPITAFAGECDASTTPARLQAWQRETMATFELLVFQRRHHFFMDEEHDALVQTIQLRLRERRIDAPHVVSAGPYADAPIDAAD